MADYQIKDIHGFQYVDTKKKMWIVTKNWSTGKIERVLAFESENLARRLASVLVGKETGVFIGLETIEVVTQVA